MYPAFEALLEHALDRAVAGGALPLGERPACRLEPPADAAFGDATTRVAMTIARRLRRPADDVARTIAAHVADPDGWLTRVEAAGPGFLNLEASLPFWRAALAARLSGSPSPRSPQGRALVAIGATSDAMVATRAALVAHGMAGLLAAAGYAVARAAFAAEDGARGGVPPDAAGFVRIVVVHDAGEPDVARRTKSAVAAVGGRPGCVTAVPIGSLALHHRGRRIDDAAATIASAHPAVRFATLELPPDAPATLDVDRLAGDRIDDSWTRIRYATARIARLGPAPALATGVLDALDEPERECLRAVGTTPDVVTVAARRLEPAAVAAHARSLAAAFHRAYNRGRFAGGTAAAVALARGVGLCLDEALEILGSAGVGRG